MILWKSIPRNTNTNKEDIKLSHTWKVSYSKEYMMFSQKPIYILQKYLSEHISSGLLWEHILRLLFTKCMQVRSDLSSQIEHYETPLPAVHIPCYTQLWEGDWGRLVSIFNTSIHTAVDCPTSSLLFPDCNFQHTCFFPPVYHSRQARVFLAA